MTTVKDIVRNAFAFFNEMYEKAEFDDILLEEVQKAETSSDWLVTIGYTRRTKTSNPLNVVTGPTYVREYKAIRVSAGGEVRGMAIRSA